MGYDQIYNTMVTAHAFIIIFLYPLIPRIRAPNIVFPSLNNIRV